MFSEYCTSMGLLSLVHARSFESLDSCINTQKTTDSNSDYLSFGYKVFVCTGGYNNQ